MEGFRFNILNEVQAPNNNFCNFETANIFSLKIEDVFGVDDIHNFRGHQYLGVSIKDILVCVDSNGKNEGYIKLGADVQMMTNSADGRFILVLTKNRYMYLIFTPTKRIIYKKAIEVEEFDFVKTALILVLNDCLSEIWIFLKESVIIYRNVNFYDIEQAISSGDDKRKLEMFSKIKIEKSVFPFLRKNDHIINIQITKSKRFDSFLMAILYPSYLIILNGHQENNASRFDYCYETNLENFAMNLNAAKSCMEISQDETHVFILDERGVLWICNFIMGCINKIVIYDDGVFTGIVLSPDMIISRKRYNDNNHQIEILSHQTLKKIESFSISSRSIICPLSREHDPVLIIDISDIDSQLIILKSINKLNVDARLKEIISTNNFECAFKFAEIFNLDKEVIFIHQLKYILFITKDGSALSTEQYDSIYECMQNIKNFFDIEVFNWLFAVIMPWVDRHGIYLKLLHAQTITAPENEDQIRFIEKINKEMYQFDIFKLICSQTEFTMEYWKDFREMAYVDILFIIITEENLHILPSVWHMIEDKVDSIFVSNEYLCETILKLFNIMIIKRRHVSDFKILFEWWVLEIFPRQIDVCPEKLWIVTELFETVVRTMEATHDKTYRALSIDCLKSSLWIFNDINCQSTTAEKKAKFEVAGLLGSFEQHNPSLSISCLHDQLTQLDKLLTIYNLDLNLELLKEESKLCLASRLLDQISTYELTNDIALPKLKDFLKEFDLRTSEFFYNYIKRLISQFSPRTDEDLEARFIILLSNITEKQIRLQCLEEFASKAEVPFKDKLSQLIEKEIKSNSVNNTTVQRLKLLQRKSKITPLLIKYDVHYINAVTIKPERLLQRMLKLESSLSQAIVEDDIKYVANEFKMDILSILKIKCRVFIENIIYENEFVCSESFYKLKSIINCESYPDSTKNCLIDAALDDLKSLLALPICISYTALEIALGVARWLTEKLVNEVIRQRWLKAWDTLIFCLTLLYNPTNESISLIEFLGQDNEIRFLYHSDSQLKHIKTCIEIRINKTIKQVTMVNNYTYFHLTQELSKSIKDIVAFSEKHLEKSTFFLEICQESLQRVIDDAMKDNHYLASCVLYSHLHLVLELGQKNQICRQPLLIQNALKCIEMIDLSRNMYYLWNILKMLSNIFELYIFHNMGCLYKEYEIVFSVLSFLLLIVRGFAECEAPDNFKRVELNTVYSEKLNNYDLHHEFFPLIKSGIVVLTSMYSDTFSNNIDVFNEEVIKSLPNMWRGGLVVSGYLSAFNVMTITINEKSLPKMENRFRTTVLKKLFSDAFNNVSIIEQPFAVSILLELPREVVVDKLKTSMKKCQSSTKMLAICIVAVQTLLMRKNEFSDEERKKLFDHIFSEARKHYYSIKLRPYKISMFRICDSKHIMSKRLEILRNPRVPLQFVKEFLSDFDKSTTYWHFEAFRDLFKIDFSFCNSIDGYKIIVEPVLRRAELLWQMIPISERCFFTVNRVFGQLLEFISPYHYEILEYVYKTMNTVTLQHKYEPQIINLLYLWKRTSAIGEIERQFGEDYYVKSGQPNPVNATYLASTRLPFNLIFTDNPMLLLEPEIQSTNVKLWIELYNLFYKVGGISKKNMNPDLMQLHTVSNIFRDFIKHSKASNVVEDEEVMFLGDLYESSSSWFNEIVNLIMSFFDRLLVNSPFIDMVEKMLKELWLGEQRIHLISMALRWIDCRLSFVPCSAEDKLLEWKNKYVSIKQKMEVEKVLFENNLYTPAYTNLIPYYSLLMDTILSDVSMSSMVTATSSRKIITVIKKLSEMASVDLNEFAFNLVISTLQLSNKDSSISDHETSVLNTSSDFSMCEEGKSQLDVNYDIDSKKIELLCLDLSIKYYIKTNLFEFLRTHYLNLEQWLHTFIFLFRCYRPLEDHDVDTLRNNNNFSIFLIIVQLHSMKAAMTQFGDCSLKSLFEYLHSFRVGAKTDFARLIFYGGDDKCERNLQSRVDVTVVHMLRDLIGLCESSFNLEDKTIKHIRSQRQKNYP